MSTGYNVALSTFSHWPLDWTILVILVLVIAGESLRAGSNKAIALSLALPVSFILFSMLPSAVLLGTLVAQLQGVVQAAIFVGIVVMFFLLMYRIIAFFGSSSTAPVSSICAGVATAMILVIFWLAIPALQNIWQFGPQVQAVFAEGYRFWWLAGAYAVLALTRG